MWKFYAGKTKYPTDFLVLGKEASKTCRIIFGGPFFNTCGAVIDCKKEKNFTKFNGESYEFNFSKFAKTSYKNERDFYFRALGSLVVLSFLQLLSFSSVLSKPLSETVTSAGMAGCPMVQHL
jgi:hypothetical protein